MFFYVPKARTGREDKVKRAMIVIAILFVGLAGVLMLIGFYIRRRRFISGKFSFFFNILLQTNVIQVYDISFNKKISLIVLKSSNSSSCYASKINLFLFLSFAQNIIAMPYISVEDVMYLIEKYDAGIRRRLSDVLHHYFFLV